MKYLRPIIFFLLFGVATTACAQRSSNTSSARAAYAIPNGYEQVKKAKKKKKSQFRKNKVVKIKKKRSKNDVDAAKHRRESLSF